MGTERESWLSDLRASPLPAPTTSIQSQTPLDGAYLLDYGGEDLDQRDRCESF